MSISNIDYLKSSISSGLARTNRYAVNIVFPTGNITYSWSNIIKSLFFTQCSQISLLCESVELPGMQYATLEDKLWGPIRKMPYLPTYNDLTMIFMCDSNMKIRTLFDQWQSMIFPKNFKKNYYNDYISDIYITLLNEKNIPVYTIKCTEAYPIGLIAQPCSYGDINTYLKMEIKFAYRYYDHSDILPNIKEFLNLPPYMIRSGGGDFKDYGL